MSDHLLDEYIAAYEELRREYLRLQWEHRRVLRDLEHADSAIANDLFAHDLEAKLRSLEF